MESLQVDRIETRPYWWEAAPRPTLAPVDVSKTDVLVVGSGYTGLSAALTLSRAGREVSVVDAEAAGHGASSRNAGFVGKTLKHSFGGLMSKHGLDRAKQVYDEAQAAFDFVCSLIEHESLDCCFERCGRYMAACSTKQYDSMARELELRYRHLGDEFTMVPRFEQSDEIGSDRYYGGAVIPQLCSLHPALYHRGLLKSTMAAGANVIDYTAVISIKRHHDGFLINTSRGEICAQQVIVATNGYTTGSIAGLKRRIVPFRGFMFATEVLENEVIDRILPTNRTVHDYNNNLLYMRRAPDSTRLLFGGLTGCGESDEKKVAVRLHAKVSECFPDMRPVGISHAWGCFGGGSFDLYPHIGVRDGIHYAMGYCFAGVPMATYLGHKTALRVMGHAEAATAFDRLGFPTRSYYWGRPWFVPLLMRWYDRQDRLDGQR